MSTASEASAATAAAEPTKSPKARSWNSLILLVGALAALAFGIFGAGLRTTAPLVILTMGGIALGVCAIALYRVVEPVLRPAAWSARTADARTSVRLRELEREKQLVLKAIREIEHDFQMRRISDADHRELTHRYRARAMRLIREIDAGDDFRGLIEAELKTRLAAQTAAPEGKVEDGKLDDSKPAEGKSAS
ncbi:MAG TPA: hypothetical protein VGF45_06055 [Polyangia bacterium]